MSNENSTWTSQNQQISSNQTWNDFVLDFWEWEILEENKNPEALNDNETENWNSNIEESNDTNNENDLNFDQDNLFDDNNETKNIKDEESSENLSFSPDSSKEQINTENNPDLNDTNNTDFIEEEIENNDNIQENDKENIKESTENDLWEDFEFSFDDDSEWDNQPDNQPDNNANENANNEPENFWENQETENNNINENLETNEESSENSFDVPEWPLDNITTDDLFSEDSEQEEPLKVEDSIDNGNTEQSTTWNIIEETPNTETEDVFWNSDLFQEDPVENNSNNNTNLPEDISENWESILDESFQENNKTNEDNLASENTNQILDIFEGNTQDTKDSKENSNNEKTEDLDFVMDYNPEEPQKDNTEDKIDDKEIETVKQPEIWDLLWESSTDIPSEDNTKIDNINNFEPENNLEANNKNETESNPKTFDESTTSWEISNENSTQIDLSQFSDNSTNQNIPTYDLSDNNSESNIINNENKVSEETQEETQAKIINDTSKNIESQNIENDSKKSINQTENQEVQSTLSLDQILDSELNNNLQNSEEQKTNSINTHKKSWIFANKKMIWAGVGLFLLAGFVVVLAFPSKNSDRKAWDTFEETWDIQEYTWHYSGWEDEEYSEKPDINPQTPPTTTVIDFPEVSWEWDEDETSREWDIQPFTWDSTTWDEEDTSTKEELSINDITPIISSFKTQANKYYDQWYEIQDKQLIKYAAQAIQLCKTYEEQINNGEWLDKESFETFKSKIKPIINKMEEYIGWPNEVEEVIKPNFDDEYGFEDKDEYLDYIYKKANWEI